MKNRIKLSTLEEMTGMIFEENKLAFATEIRQHGMNCSEKTIIRAIEGKNEKDEKVEPYISNKISLPTLIRMCEHYRFPFYRCFTFYNEQGKEKPHSSLPKHTLQTNEAIHVNLLSFANDICCLYPRLQMIKADMGWELDFMKLADDDIEALSHIPATEFVDKLMQKHFDINNYIWQGEYKIPFQSESLCVMVAEDVLPTKEHIYLSAYLHERIINRDVNKDFDEKMKSIRQRGHELIERNGDLISSVYELLLLISKELRPFPKDLLNKMRQHNNKNKNL